MHVADISVVVPGQLAQLAAAEVFHIEFGFTAAVGDIGDILAVGTPSRIAFMGARRAAEVAGHAFLGRDIEDFAPGGHRQSASIGREACRRDVSGHVLALAPGIDIVAGQADFYFLALPGGRVELEQETAFFKDDDLAVGAGELDVVILEIGHFLGGLCLGVIDKEVHRQVAVGEEEDFIPDPHREDVLGLVAGDVDHGVGGRVVNPDVVGHAAPVVFPRPEFAEDPVVGQLAAIGRIAAEAAFRQGNGFGHPAFRTHLHELSGIAGPDTVAEDDLLAVGRPGHDDVVGSHAVAEVVTAVGGGVGEANRFPALGRYQIDFGVAVVLPGKGDLFSVGRVTGKHLIADVGGQPLGFAPVQRGFVEVPGIGENHFLPVGGRESEQPGFVVPGFGEPA